MAIGVLAFNLAVQAQVFTGSLDFYGGATLNQTLGTATGFTSYFGPGGTGDPLVLGGTQTGIYSSVPSGTQVTFTPFIFDPAPASPFQFWTLTSGSTTYSFDITSVTTDFQNSNFLNLAGQGVAFIGSTALPSVWSLTDTGGGSSLNVTFGVAVTAVPEPSSIVLFFAGLVTCLVIAFRRQLATAD